jgi:O-antigen ligase
MRDTRAELIDTLPGLRAATDIWRAERIAIGGYILTFALFFLVPAATQRMVFYVLVCAPVIVLIAKQRIEWRMFVRHAGLALAAALIAAHVVTMAWSTGITVGHAYHDGKDALALAVFAYVTTWFVLHRHDVFWRAWLPAFLLAATTTGIVALAVHVGGAGGTGPFTAFGAADHPNAAATLYGVVAILAATSAARSRTSAIAVAAAVVAASVGVICVILSESRAGIIALAAAAAAVLVRSGRLGYALAIAGVVAVLILGAHATGLIDLHVMLAEGSNSRFALWADAIAHIRERPLLGHGMLTEIEFQGTDGLYRSPHNLLLSTQVFAGAAGTLLLLILIGVTLQRGIALARTGTIAPLALMVFGLVNGLFAFRTLVDGLDRTWLAFWFPVLLIHAEYEWARRRDQDQDRVGQA